MLAVFSASADVPDGAEGSLRHAIDLAQQNSEDDTIELAAGTYQLTLQGTGEDGNATGDLDWNDQHALTIRGQGDAHTVIDASGLSDRALEVHAGNVTIEGITIQGGSNVSAGGGIANRGTLEVRDITLQQNRSDYEGGAINNRGSLSVINSRFLDNYADYEGGGIELNFGGSAIITDSYFADNTSGYEGGAISVGTVTRGPVELVLTNSTLANNRADYSGGGIDVDGQAVVEIVNTTFSGNSARYEGGGIAVTGRADLLNTTFTGNVASHSGGAIDVTDSWRVGAVTARNSIIHGGISGANRFTDLGHNLIGPDPELEPLADNGGPTPTHALLPSSLAIDAGDNTDAPATDQRGFPRITDGDGDGEPTIDIGAFESPRIHVFIVNSERDAVDQNPGNGVVDTGVEGEITLRAAIMEANTLAEHSRIHLPAGTYPLSRNGEGADDSAGDLDVRSDIAIVGVGADHSVVDANNSDGGFEVHDQAILSLEGITVRNTNGNGGIVNHGDLLVERSHLLNNNAGSRVGGGIANLGGNATIRATYIAFNESGAAGEGGGIYSRDGNLIVTASTLYQNTSGAAGEGGGILVDGGEAVISHSTISGNSSGASGTGGGIFVRSGFVSINASTIYQNKTTAGGNGGGIFNAGGTVFLTSSIVARNQVGNLVGDITDNGFNFIGGDPRLGSLSDNGGPTPTHSPTRNSPVLDQGNSAGHRTDQRGKPRVVDLAIPNAPDGDGSDIGAVELQNAAPQAQDDQFVVLQNKTLNTLHDRYDNPRSVLENDIDLDGDELTAILVSQPNHGELSLNADGSFRYVANRDFHGVDTFAYRAVDHIGESGIATVSIEVVPSSSISGFSYLDRNDDGIKQQSEIGIRRTPVLLYGFDIWGNRVFRVRFTNRSGEYHFDDLAPGRYTVTKLQRPIFRDGKDTIGTQGGDDSANNRFVIQLEAGTEGRDNNFGERGFRFFRWLRWSRGRP